jgi:hypothetical protein
MTTRPARNGSTRQCVSESWVSAERLRTALIGNSPQAAAPFEAPFPKERGPDLNLPPPSTRDQLFWSIVADSEVPGRPPLNPTNPFNSTVIGGTAKAPVAVSVEPKHDGLHGTAAPHMLTQGDIGRLLRPFAIRSKTLWPGRRPGTKSESGYSRQ